MHPLTAEFKERVRRINRDARWINKNVRGSEELLKLLKLDPAVPQISALSRLAKPK